MLQDLPRSGDLIGLHVPFFPFQRPKRFGCHRTGICRTRGCNRPVHAGKDVYERDVDHDRCYMCTWLHMLGVIFVYPAIIMLIVIWLSGGSIIDFLKGS